MPEEHEIICTMCPLGCHVRLVVNEAGEPVEVSDYGCKLGRKYAINELKFPGRILTATVRTESGARPLLPVKTNKPIAKDKIFEAMNFLVSLKLRPPVKLGQVILSNIAGTGADLVSTDELLV